MFRGPGSDFYTWRGLRSQCDSSLRGDSVFMGPGSDFSTLRGPMAQFDSGLGGTHHLSFHK